MFNPDSISLSEVERIIYKTEESYVLRHSSRSSILKKFLNLTSKIQEVATYGIKRHIYYCNRCDVAYDLDAMREIIDDAILGYKQALQNERELIFCQRWRLGLRNYMNLFQEDVKTRRRRRTPILFG